MSGSKKGARQGLENRMRKCNVHTYMFICVRLLLSLCLTAYCMYKCVQVLRMQWGNKQELSGVCGEQNRIFLCRVYVVKVNLLTQGFCVREGL